MSTQVIEILFVNPPKTGTTAKGTKWSMTEAECIIRSSEGVPSVGVLLLGRDMDGTKLTPGTYTAIFGLEVGYKDRKIGAVVTELVPFTASKPAQPARVAA